MIEIEVDTNNDCVRINNGSPNCVIVKVRYPNEIVHLLEEVLNGICYKGETVSLTKVEEEHKQLIDEWSF